MTGVKDIVTIMAKAAKFKFVLESRIPGRVQAGTSRVHGQAGSHSKTKEDLRVTQLGRNQQHNVSAGWPTGVATGGLQRSPSDGVLRDSRLQSLLETGMVESGTNARRREASTGLLDGRQVVDKYGALDKFKALAPTSSMDFETAMEEDWVLDKSKAPERDYLMDFKRVTAEFEVEVLNKLSRTWTRATSSKSSTCRRRRT